MEPELFNNFVSRVHSGIECSPRNNTKLCEVVNTLEERDAIQRVLDSLERWTCVNFMKLNKAK